MKKTLLRLLAAALLLSLTACGGTKAPETSPTLPTKPEATAVSPEPFPTEAPEASPVPSTDPAGDAGRYYDLFQSDAGLVTLFGLMEDGDGGFTDDQLCAYALTMLALEGNYDFEVGVDREDLNAVAWKHFGQSIQNFENSMTTVLDSGRVTATGWSFDGSVYLALDGQARERDGVTDARFKCYFLSDSVWLDQEIEQEKLDHIKDYLLSGDDGDFPEPQLVEIMFEARVDEETGSPYVFYHSITSI